MSRSRFAVAALCAWTLIPASLLSFGGSVPAAADEPAYVVDVQDVTAKVGEPAVLRATLKARDGYRVLKHYRNNLGRLSSLDDGVAFGVKSTPPATLEDDTLVFEVPVQATKPGKHPINGVFRVGYIHGTDEMSMVSVRLIANVTGTE